MNDASLTVGVDIGGSKIAAGIVDGSGRLLRSGQLVTPARQGRAAIAGATVRLVRNLIEGEEPAGEAIDARTIGAVGVGAAGVIGPDGRVVAATDLLTGWTGTDVAGFVRTGLEPLGIRGPVVVVNDVHAHGAGEAWCGAAAGKDLVLLVAVGTGLGGAVVHRGSPLGGAHGAAGHLGHVHCPAAEGLSCSCGATGHLEAIASGYGLVRLYHRLGGDQSVTSARDLGRLSGGDATAEAALITSAAALGAAVGDFITVLDPDVVVISGGVSEAGPAWWHSLRSAAGQATLPLLRETAIVPATLGSGAGIIGAAHLAADAAVKERT